MTGFDLRPLQKVKEIHDSLQGFACSFPQNSFKQFVFCANAAAARENEAVLVLLQSSLEAPALAHARGLYELGVTARFIASGGLSSKVVLADLPTDSGEIGRLKDEVDRRSEAFLMYSLHWMVRYHRRLKLTALGDAEVEALEAATRKFEYDKFKSWWPKNLREMALDVAEERRYELVYPLGSDVIHHGAHALLRDHVPDVQWMDGELVVWSSIQDLEYLLMLFELEFQPGIASGLDELRPMRQEIQRSMGD